MTSPLVSAHDLAARWPTVGRGYRPRHPLPDRRARRPAGVRGGARARARRTSTWTPTSPPARRRRASRAVVTRCRPRRLSRSAMRRAGVRRDRPVVVYDDWGGRAAARAWWLLRYHGHRDVRVLDGGWAAWLDAGGASEEGVVDAGARRLHRRPRSPARGGRRGRARPWRCWWTRGPPSGTPASTSRSTRSPGTCPARSTCRRPRTSAPTARFKSPDELRRIYAAVGAVAGADVAAYCGSGVTACHDLLALAVARVPAALYAGSWSDWVSDPARPVAGPPA